MEFGFISFDEYSRYNQQIYNQNTLTARLYAAAAANPPIQLTRPVSSIGSSGSSGSGIAASSALKSAIRSVAQVPQPVSASTTAQTTMQNVQSLASVLNPQMKADFEAGLESALPGYKGLLADIAKTTQSMMSGQLPADVQASIDQMTAERNLQGGIAGGGAGSIGSFSIQRNLGVEALKYMQAGTSEALRLAELLPKYASPTVNQADMFASIYGTERKIAADKYSTDAQRATEYARMSLDAAKYSSDLAWKKELSAMEKETELFNIQFAKDYMARQDTNAALEGTIAQNSMSRFFA